MKPQTPGRGFFYVLMMEETGNFSPDCPGLYTRIFRIWAGSWSGAYTAYSKIQGSDRFRVWSVYKILEKPGPGQNLYTQKFRAWTGFGSGAYTRYSKKLGPGEICILKNSGLGQVPSPGRIQKAQKIQGPGRLQIDQFYARLSMQAWFHI